MNRFAVWPPHGSITRESLDSHDAEACYYVVSILEAKGFDTNSHFQVVPVSKQQSEVRWRAAFTLPANIPTEKAAKACQRNEQMYLFFLQQLQAVMGRESPDRF